MPGSRPRSAPGSRAARAAAPELAAAQAAAGRRTAARASEAKPRSSRTAGCRASRPGRRRAASAGPGSPRCRRRCGPVATAAAPVRLRHLQRGSGSALRGRPPPGSGGEGAGRRPRRGPPRWPEGPVRRPFGHEAGIGGGGLAAQAVVQVGHVQADAQLLAQTSTARGAGTANRRRRRRPPPRSGRPSGSACWRSVRRTWSGTYLRTRPCPGRPRYRSRRLPVRAVCVHRVRSRSIPSASAFARAGGRLTPRKRPQVVPHGEDGREPHPLIQSGGRAPWLRAQENHVVALGQAPHSPGSAPAPRQRPGAGPRAGW